MSENKGGGPGSYTTNDLIFWGGLISATCIVFLALQTLEFPALLPQKIGDGMEWTWGRVLHLALSIGSGVCVGYVCETLYRRSQQPPPPDRTSEE